MIPILNWYTAARQLLADTDGREGLIFVGSTVVINSTPAHSAAYNQDLAQNNRQMTGIEFFKQQTAQRTYRQSSDLILDDESTIQLSV